MKDRISELPLIAFEDGGVLVNGNKIPCITGFKVDSDRYPLSEITIKFLGQIKGLDTGDPDDLYKFKEPQKIKNTSDN